MASVQLVSELKTEGAPSPPCHAPSRKMKPRFTRPGLFILRIGLKPISPSCRGRRRRNPKPAERAGAARCSFVIEILYSVLYGVSMHPQEMASCSQATRPVGKSLVPQVVLRNPDAD